MRSDRRRQQLQQRPGQRILAASDAAACRCSDSAVALRRLQRLQAATLEAAGVATIAQARRLACIRRILEGVKDFLERDHILEHLSTG